MWWILAVPVVLSGCKHPLVDQFLGRGIDGPTFLMAYFVVWISLVVFSVVMRNIVSGSSAPTWLALILFVGLGLARFGVGWAVGMRKFLFLFMMMIVGSIILLGIRPKDDRGSDEDW